MSRGSNQQAFGTGGGECPAAANNRLRGGGGESFVAAHRPIGKSNPTRNVAPSGARLRKAVVRRGEAARSAVPINRTWLFAQMSNTSSRTSCANAPFFFSC